MNFTYRSVYDYFTRQFAVIPVIVRSPGRINLIGEHVDYNDGFVMPAAIDKEIIFAVAESHEEKSKIYSLNYNESVEVDLNNAQPVQSPSWANYILGVARQFNNKGVRLKQVSCVFGGNIPVGSGLSSSAALECGFAVALCQFNSQNFSKHELAKIGQWAEHNFVGVRCGIMDQFANMLGKEDHVIQLDCRSLEHTYLPLRLKDCSIVLLNSKVKHSLVSSEYNIRREQCEEGLGILNRGHPSVVSFRDISVDMLFKSSSKLSPEVFDRCRYVVEEIQRVQDAGIDLQNHDLDGFGKKMFETHEGLSKLYKVSCAELDFLVSAVQDEPGVLGARMMGGGFGGCTINIIENNCMERMLNEVSEKYRRAFNIDLDSYVVRIKDGTSITSIS